MGCWPSHSLLQSNDIRIDSRLSRPFARLAVHSKKGAYTMEPNAKTNRVHVVAPVTRLSFAAVAAVGK